jgi:hypothetical protein
MNLEVDGERVLIHNIRHSSKVLPSFEPCGNYKGIGATFDNDNRCIPGFLYIRSKESMQLLANYFAKTASLGKYDMDILGMFKKENNSEVISHLPIIHFKYIEKYHVFGGQFHKLKNKYDFCSHIDKFNSIFDAAALGQYLGGD